MRRVCAIMVSIVRHCTMLLTTGFTAEKRGHDLFSSEKPVEVEKAQEAQRRERYQPAVSKALQEQATPKEGK